MLRDVFVWADERSCQEAIRAAIPATVAEGDRAKFFALIEKEFKNLHEGNAIRFGLRPLELAAWKRAFCNADKVRKKSS